MNCYWCNGELITGADMDTDASMHKIFYDKYSVMTNLTCSKCDSEVYICLLYTSDAADEGLGVDL